MKKILGALLFVLLPPSIYADTSLQIAVHNSSDSDDSSVEAKFFAISTSKGTINPVMSNCECSDDSGGMICHMGSHQACLATYTFDSSYDGQSVSGSFEVLTGCFANEQSLMNSEYSVSFELKNSAITISGISLTGGLNSTPNCTSYTSEIEGVHSIGVSYKPYTQ